ncbi:hypothetical protein GGI42DRAFT_67716 [Trichoderma sp. SZMC 28013]
MVRSCSMAQWPCLSELTRPPAEHTSSSSASRDGNILTPLRPTVRASMIPLSFYLCYYERTKYYQQHLDCYYCCLLPFPYSIRSSPCGTKLRILYTTNSP